MPFFIPLLGAMGGFVARTLGISAARGLAARTAGAGAARAAGAGAAGTGAAAGAGAAGAAGAGAAGAGAGAAAGGMSRGALMGSMISKLFGGDEEGSLGEKLVKAGKDAVVQRVKQSDVMRSKPVQAISVLYSYSKKLKDTLKEAKNENEEVLRESLPPAIPPIVPNISDSENLSGFQQYALRERAVIEVVRENEEKRIKNDRLNRKKNPTRTLIDGLMSSVSLLQDESKDSIDEEKRYEYALKNQQEEENIEGEKQQKLFTEIKDKGFEKVKEYSEDATNFVKLFLLQFAPAAGLLGAGAVFAAGGLIKKGLGSLKDFLTPDIFEEARELDSVLNEQSEKGKQTIMSLPGRIIGLFRGNDETSEGGKTIPGIGSVTPEQYQSWEKGELYDVVTTDDTKVLMTREELQIATREGKVAPAFKRSAIRKAEARRKRYENRASEEQPSPSSEVTTTQNVGNVQEEKIDKLKDMATRMGLEPSDNITGKFVGGVPVEVNGRIVPEEIYTDEERRNVNAARQVSSSMGNRQQPRNDQQQAQSSGDTGRVAIVTDQTVRKAIIPEIDRIGSDVTILNQAVEQKQNQQSLKPGSQGPSTPTSAFPSRRTTDPFFEQIYLT